MFLLVRLVGDNQLIHLRDVQLEMQRIIGTIVSAPTIM